MELQLKDKWLLRKVDDCNDLSQISQTLRWGEEAMCILDKAAKRLTTFQNLSSITMADEVFESVNRITSDTYQGSMKRFANGLERLFGLIY